MAPPRQPSPWDSEEATTKRDSLVGMQIGEYEVTAPLGEGGMGIVYQGVQPMIGKSVAIKVLRQEMASDPMQVKRLLDEARAVNSIRHPGIIDIFSFGKLPDGRQYFVMELLKGSALDQVLFERKKLAAGTLLEILDQTLSALSAAHGAGVIHRDLKPSNLFLADMPDGTHYVKLLDFGLAKLGAMPHGSAAQTSNMIMGTPEYIAPEQARGEPVGPYTDLYSLGVVVFELLTGKLPFEAESVVELVLKHLNEAPPKPSDFEPTVPPELDAIVSRMMAKTKAERPKSAAELRKEVQELRRQYTSGGQALRPVRALSDPPSRNAPAANPGNSKPGLKAVEAGPSKPGLKAVEPSGSRPPLRAPEPGPSKPSLKPVEPVSAKHKKLPAPERKPAQPQGPVPSKNQSRMPTDPLPEPTLLHTSIDARSATAVDGLPVIDAPDPVRKPQPQKPGPPILLILVAVVLLAAFAAVLYFLVLAPNVGPQPPRPPPVAADVVKLSPPEAVKPVEAAPAAAPVEAAEPVAADADKPAAAEAPAKVPKPKHSLAQVGERIARLRERAAQEPSAQVQRIILRTLDAESASLKNGADPEKVWKSLDQLETQSLR